MRELPSLLPRRDLRAFLEITRGVERERSRRRSWLLDVLTPVIQNNLTRRGIVGYRRYRGAAAAAVARGRGDTYFGQGTIYSVPIYRNIAPPPGIARNIAAQLI